MRTLKLAVCGLILLSQGLAGVAAAALCPKCQEMMFTCDIGRCKECGGDTSSGGYGLCKVCGEKLGQCQACRAALKSDRPAGDAGSAKVQRPVARHKVHALPQDPKAIVVQYRVGAHMMGRMLPASGPDLVVLADGTVIAHDPFGRPPAPPEHVIIEAPQPVGMPEKVKVPEPAKPPHVASVRGAIGPEDVQDLLGFILDENRFFEFDSKVAADKYNETKAPRIADAASTTFEVTADGRTYKGWVYAIDSVNYADSQVPELARMQAVYNRLVSLRKKTISDARNAGSPPAVK